MGFVPDVFEGHGDDSSRSCLPHEPADIAIAKLIPLPFVLVMPKVVVVIQIVLAKQFVQHNVEVINYALVYHSAVV